MKNLDVTFVNLDAYLTQQAKVHYNSRAASRASKQSADNVLYFCKVIRGIKLQEKHKRMIAQLLNWLTQNNYIDGVIMKCAVVQLQRVANKPQQSMAVLHPRVRQEVRERYKSYEEMRKAFNKLVHNECFTREGELGTKSWRNLRNTQDTQQ